MRTLRNAVAARQGPPRLPVRRLARHRQDLDGEDPRRVPELRARPDDRAVRACATRASRSRSATSLDVIEMDAASNNSVDDIRELRENVAYAPVSGRHKVYILDEAHMLSTAAWNAFLKTLEEPPPNTVFVLATTEAQKVPPTVVDRCHRFDFHRPTVEQIATRAASASARGRVDRDPAGGGRGAGRASRDGQLPRRARARSSSSSPTAAREIALAGRARGARRGRRRAAGSASTRSPPATPGARCAALRGAASSSGRDAGLVRLATSRSTRASCSSCRCSARSRPSCRSPRSATRAWPRRPSASAHATSSACSSCSARRSRPTARGRRRAHPARAGAGQGRDARARPARCGRCWRGSSGSSAGAGQRRRAGADDDAASSGPRSRRPRTDGAVRARRRARRATSARRCRPVADPPAPIRAGAAARAAEGPRVDMLALAGGGRPGARRERAAGRR